MHPSVNTGLAYDSQVKSYLLGKLILISSACTFPRMVLKLLMHAMIELVSGDATRAGGQSPEIVG